MLRCIYTNTQKTSTSFILQYTKYYYKLIVPYPDKNESIDTAGAIANVFCI